MYVSVFDEREKRYYKSIVYAIFKIEGQRSSDTPSDFPRYVEEYAVVHDDGSERLKLIPRYYESTSLVANVQTREHKTAYNILQPRRDDWVAASDGMIASLNEATDTTVFSIEGYDDVVNNLPLCVKLLRQRNVQASEAQIDIRQLEDSDEWTYIASQEDADAMLRACELFHDYVVDKMLYESVDDVFTITVDLTLRQKYIRVCFEGVIAMNLRTYIDWRHEMPFSSREIAFINVAFWDECVTWITDGRIEDIMDDETNYIKSISMKWQIVK